jgi:ribonuclease HII
MEPEQGKKTEILLNDKGFLYVAGVDEAGRGPLAGPVVACAACVLDWDMDPKLLDWVKDSKKMTEKRREAVYEIVSSSVAIKYAIGIMDEKMIDEINIFQATKKAMILAVSSLQESLPLDFLIIDGNATIDHPIRQKAVIKGDSKIFSCSIASVMAKVTRDRMMLEYARKYPQYGFEKHKGYGTKSHIEAIQKFGPCQIHRRTFNPVSLFI